MLIHSAIFWLKKDLTPADRALFESELQRLARIPYLNAGFAGPVAATPERGVTDHTFDYATSFQFKSLADHEYYQKECPDHARFVATCKGFFDRVIVYDLDATGK